MQRRWRSHHYLNQGGQADEYCAPATRLLVLGERDKNRHHAPGGSTTTSNVTKAASPNLMNS
jgi:hypothetical protein